MWKVLTLNSVSDLNYHWLVPWRSPDGGYKEGCVLKTDIQVAGSVEGSEFIKEKSFPHGEFCRRLWAGPAVRVRGISAKYMESKRRNRVLVGVGCCWEATAI